jgi:flagellar biosynthesis protein FlhA
MFSTARVKYLILPVSVLAGLLVVLTPLPPALMDLLLSINIALAVIVLLTTIFVRTPLEFSVFPSVLLATTLSRLVLNVATTRLILIRGQSDGLSAAGGVVRAFSEFVTGNEIVVGIIIFAIIVIIQFFVITQGATRISEVAARFALDGMPGRQMAIDADLNAGLIDREQAHQRRKEITRQADFYGAMDGASKFVRGDAIAGVLITVINIFGGLFVGVAQAGMGIGQATDIYTRLTIGDGLVSQVPALLISLAAGLLITRSSESSDLSADFFDQIFARPRTLVLAAGFLLVLALTGLPALPLILLACGCAGIALFLHRSDESDEEDDAAARERAPTPATNTEQRVEDYLRVDPLEIELGVGLLRLADPDRGGDLLARIAALRTKVASDLGLVLPKVRIRDNIRLDDHGYRINISNHRVASGTSLPHSVLAIDMGRATGVLDGIPDRDPATNRTAIWIDSASRREAESMGYVVLPAVDVILTHLNSIVYRNADELLTRDATKHLIEELRHSAPTVVEELVPDVLRISEVQQVLKRLLREGVSIRSLATILETVGDYASLRREPWFLAERARERLARSLSGALRDRQGTLYALSLAPDLERQLIERIEKNNGEPCLNLPSVESKSLLASIGRSAASLRQNGQPEVIVVDATVRLALRGLTQAELPDLHVISVSEVSRDTHLKTTSTIGAMELVEQVA